MTVRIFGILLLCLAPLVARPAMAADEIAELKRAVEALQAQNSVLARRLETLEAQRGERAQASVPAAAPASTDDPQTLPIEQRVKELESARIAQESAVRSIIRDSVATLGPKINESAALGGTLSMGVGRSTDFSTGVRNSSIGFDSASFEFEYQMNEWSLGHVKLDYDNGRSVLFQTAAGTQAGVDRINVDTAYITLGNQLKFPPALTLGRAVLPFGTSTGHPVTDALSIASALTVDAFEMRQNMFGLNLRWPTPKLGPPTPPVVAPPVRPQFVYPMISSLANSMGYNPPPTRPKPLAPTAFAPEVAPFGAGVYVFESRTPGGISKHFGGTLEYTAKGNCGRRYEELTGIGLCPWALNADLSYNSSIFSSRFLETQYDSFLNQIGRVPGAAASVKASLGPFSLVSEWNGAIKQAKFVDDLNRPIAIKPAAWQLSLGYQLDWNPWVREIGAQGSYVSIAYSQSRDLAGVSRLVGGQLSRVGLVPKRRLLLTAGEWMVDGVRLALEYSREWDYLVSERGTDRVSNGISANLVYAW